MSLPRDREPVRHGRLGGPARYLDVNGDGVVTDADKLEANDQVGDGMNAFQVQHPGGHAYASSTGDAMDCPQPDLGVVPGERTDWTP